jgi:hypothetical protein
MKKERTEVGAADELHHHEVGVSGLSPVVHGHDVGMAEHPRGAGFPAESIDERSIAGERGVKDLDGHVPIEDRIVSTVNLAHTTRSDTGYDLIAAVYGCLDHGSVMGGATSSPF